MTSVEIQSNSKEKRGAWIHVKASTDESWFKRLESHSWFIRRIQSDSRPREIFDSFADYWSIAFSDNIPRNKIFLERQGRRIPMPAKSLLIVPPHILLHWHTEGLSFSWSALIQRGPLPSGFPKEARLVDVVSTPHLCSLISSSSFENPSPDFFSKLFEGISNCPQFCVAEDPGGETLGTKVKDLIDRTYSSPYSMNDLAGILGCSLGSMSRAFVRDFGLTPIAYRNHMRVFVASLELPKGGKIVDVGQTVGFHDLSRFNKQFKQRLNAVPRQFRVR